MLEILETSVIYNNKIFIPKSIREVLELENGNKIIWARNKNGEIVILSNKINYIKADDIIGY